MTQRNNKKRQSQREIHFLQQNKLHKSWKWEKALEEAFCITILWNVFASNILKRGQFKNNNNDATTTIDDLQSKE